MSYFCIGMCWHPASRKISASNRNWLASYFLLTLRNYVMIVLISGCSSCCCKCQLLHVAECCHRHYIFALLTCSLGMLGRNTWQAATLTSFLDSSPLAAAYLGQNLLYCPLGYIAAGYQGRAYVGGIDYLDVSVSFTSLSLRLLLATAIVCPCLSVFLKTFARRPAHKHIDTVVLPLVFHENTGQMQIAWQTQPPGNGQSFCVCMQVICGRDLAR